MIAAQATLLVVPWLWPYAWGPSPGVPPLLVAWCCGLAFIAWRCLSAGSGADLAVVARRAWLVAALASAAVGLAQWFGVAPDTSLVSPAAIGEAYGNLRQRNQFASLTSIGFAVLVCLAGRVRWAGLAAAALLLAAANAASASRTGLLQWVVISLVVAWWPRQRRERLLLCGLGLAAYCAAAVLLPDLLWHWRGVQAPDVFGRAVADLGCSSRKVLWANVLHLVAQRPWVGWGWGELDYAHYITLYDGARFCDILDNAHNLPLHIAVELGVPAALLLVGGIVAAVWTARPWRETQDHRQLAWLVLLVVGLHSLLEYPLWYGPFQLAVLLAIALLVPARAALPHGARSPTVAACTLAVVALAVVGWTYDRVSDAYRPAEQRRAALRQDPVAALAGTPLFREQVRFARLSLLPVTRADAAEVHALALDMLHYSPEPMVIEKILDSALLLGRDGDVLLHARRYKAAFPDRYEAWRASHGLTPPAG